MIYRNIMFILKGNAKTGIPSCVISKINAMNYMKDALLNKQKKIEIYSASKNSPNSWTLSKKVNDKKNKKLFFFFFFKKEK